MNICSFSLDNMPAEEDAMSLAAPAVAVASNQTKMVGHTAPLLPTPPSMSTLAAAAAAVSSAGLVGAVPAMAAVLATSVIFACCDNSSIQYSEYQVRVVNASI